ncbi:PTS sugar transporter subunit IIA [Kibdelosporangium aridum]|uniref:PTS system, N-acetylglucosamine-specific IIA component n=1 Tax=Kibdelosporangium aridum TaxID=2030 RepID=A0A1W2FIH7_KIBAR|nr:PTS glucose transporter subunit IIA [Kibdelosporangium aridum]SMD21845.1 PTS system, N-acetylglucosamine-specific IIA component [Kibdelosporangium aridum]
MTLRVSSPVSGSVVALSAVPDPVFAQTMVGPGVAVQPSTAAADVLSPIDGVVVTLHPHAFVVAGDSGQAVLVHLGIDTVKMKGDGFTLHVVKGETVRAGQPIIGWNPAAVEAVGYSSICPVVALDAQNGALTDVAPDGPVNAGDTLFLWHP